MGQNVWLSSKEFSKWRDIGRNEEGGEIGNSTFELPLILTQQQRSGSKAHDLHRSIMKLEEKNFEINFSVMISWSSSCKI